MDAENREILLAQEDDPKKWIREGVERALVNGDTITLPVQPGLEFEIRSGGANEIIQYIVNGEPEATLRSLKLDRNLNYSVTFRARNSEKKTVDIRYNEEGKRQLPEEVIPRQQRNNEAEQPSTYLYPQDFPEEVELKKVVGNLKEYFKMKKYQRLDLNSLSKAKKDIGVKSRASTPKAA